MSLTETSKKPVPASFMRSSIVVASMTMLSRVMGLARDVVIAVVFGAGNSADAFFVAFKIPNFLRRLFAEGAFNQAFVPVLAEVSSEQDQQALRNMVARVSGSLLLVLLLLTVLAVLAAPLLVWIFAPGFAQQPEKLALTADMLRLTFPYLLLISMTGFFGSLLNHSRQFAIPAITPVLLNLSLIGAAWWLAPKLAVPVTALAWGVLVAGCLQLMLQLPFVARLGLLSWPRFGFADGRVRQVMKLMLPALFGVSVAQINLLLDTVLASLLQPGSVSWLYYSDRLMELPLGVFGIAIATVILPGLSRQHAGDDQVAFSATLDWAVRMILLIGIPAALALWVLAEPLLATLFHYGAMQERDVLLSAASLRAYAAGLLAFMLIKVLAPGYFARQDMRTPVRFGVWAMAANMVFNLSLIWHFQHVGLAMATSLSAFLNAGLLALGLWRQGVWQPTSGWALWCLQLGSANLAMLGLLLWLRAPVQQWLQWGLWQRLEQLALLVVGGVFCYLIVLLLAGVRQRHLRGHETA
ncbi:MAG: murein biosynthesis integral membrane protein MurJ [Gammaproteobacteria bacterium]|nr:murein biosynthesis integral membrane protein MurJ [Gammaproteobacteria bacterium]MCP4880422.1 murein biosynthesis integral membrane protein MurJ [Gammaproteobacteria bacterium]MDP6166189.1 murein biosynthesis integral membrane protein MurJ [Gammaproteobacteria bacterium]